MVASRESASVHRLLPLHDRDVTEPRFETQTGCRDITPTATQTKPRPVHWKAATGALSMQMQQNRGKKTYRFYRCLGNSWC